MDTAVQIHNIALQYLYLAMTSYEESYTVRDLLNIVLNPSKRSPENYVGECCCVWERKHVSIRTPMEGDSLLQHLLVSHAVPHRPIPSVDDHP